MFALYPPKKCKDIFELVRENWSFDEHKKMYVWKSGPMSIDGDMLVQEHSQCFEGFRKKKIKSLLGEPTQTHGDTSWTYSYGPVSSPNTSYAFVVDFGPDDYCKDLRISIRSATFNKD
jgi:hypothetical protein